MAQDIVRFIKIQTGDSERSINQLNKEISQLSDELNGLTINSKRYNEISKELAIRQKELTNINQSLQVASRTTQQRFENLQKFSSGLTAGFTTLASTFALLGTGSENFDKTITKLTGSLAILQSIGGLKDLIESFPGVISGFKNIGDSIKRFFTGAVNSFDPLERRLTTAANNLKNIGKVDIKADIKTSGTVGKDIQTPITTNTNKQLAEQQRTIVPLNEQWNKYNKELQEALSYISDYSSDLEKLRKIFLEYNKTSVGEATVNIKQLDKATKELYKGNLEPMRKFFDALILDQDALEATARSMGVTYDQLTVGLKNFGNNVTEDLEYLKGLRQQLLEVEKAGGKAVTGISKFGGILKSIFTTVGWTLIISLIVGAIYKLFDYIKTLKTAAKEQKEFNQELNKTTSELSSSKLAKFYELQKAFEQVGNTAKDKEQFLKDYSDGLKEIGLAINDVQTAEDAFINNTDKYVQAIIARAKIDAYKEQITKKTQETLEKNLELERKIDANKPTFGQSVGSALRTTITGETLKESDLRYAQENAKKYKKEIEKNNKELNDFITKQVGNISKLNKEYSSLWAKVTPKDKETKETTEDIQLPDIQPLLDEITKEINDFIEAEYDVVLGDREKELRNLEENWFKPYKALYETYGGDINQLTEEYERRRKAIIDKYKPDTKDTQKELESQLTAIKETFDFQSKQLSLYKSKTTYKQLGLTFQYQSGSDVKKEYQNTLDYNNQVYNLTAERIKKENEIYNKQLENSQLTADEKLNIERKLSENTKALQDAELQRDQDNTQAAIDMQRKKLQAFQATAQVTSSVLGSLGSAFDTKAQLAKTEKEQKKAAKTAKGFKAAQAVIDALSAANGAYSSMSSIPYVGPALGAAAAAAALIAGYANVKQILAQDVSGSTIQQATGTPASVNVPAVSYTRNLVGDKELEEINKPQVCLVVEDLNNVQNRMQVRESNATF